VRYDTITFPAGTVTDAWLHEHREQLHDHDRLGLILDGNSISDDGLQAFVDMKCLHYLSAQGTELSHTGFQLLASCPNLVAINIADTDVTADHLKHFTAFPALQSIGLDASQATAISLETICQLPTVSNLTVFGATNETAAQLRLLCGNKRLMLLDSTLTEESIPDLAAIKTVISLTFADPEVPIAKWQRFKSALNGCSMQAPDNTASDSQTDL